MKKIFNLTFFYGEKLIISCCGNGISISEC